MVHSEQFIHLLISFILNDAFFHWRSHQVIGAKWERRLLPCGAWDFDTVVNAIGSNDVKWGCNDVVLQFERPGEANEDEVKKHLEFFEPPFDSMWKRG